METSWLWILGFAFLMVLFKVIGLRGIVNSYRKNQSNKIFYIVGLFLILSLGWYFWDKSYHNNTLASLAILFVIVMVYTFVWKKSGYYFGTERYENTAVARVVKFFGAFILAAAVILLILLILLSAGR